MELKTLEEKGADYNLIRSIEKKLNRDASNISVRYLDWCFHNTSLIKKFDEAMRSDGGKPSGQQYARMYCFNSIPSFTIIYKSWEYFLDYYNQDSGQVEYEPVVYSCMVAIPYKIKEIGGGFHQFSEDEIVLWEEEE